jgi:hypothetical protein
MYFIWILHMMLWLYIYVSKYFRCMFQVFHLDVACVTMAIYECFKRMFRVFQMFQTYVASILFECCKSRSECCICCYDYTRMFQVFHLFQTYVASVSFGCFKNKSRGSTCCNGMVLLLCGSPYISKVSCCCVGRRATVGDRAACYCWCWCVHAGMWPRCLLVILLCACGHVKCHRDSLEARLGCLYCFFYFKLISTVFRCGLWVSWFSCGLWQHPMLTSWNGHLGTSNSVFEAIQMYRPLPHPSLLHSLCSTPYHLNMSTYRVALSPSF